MNLEKTVRFHFPKSTHITDEPRSTNEDRLMTSDVMAALGLAQGESGFGMSAFFGKLGISQHDKNLAITALMKLVRHKLAKVKCFEDVSGHRRGRAIYLIALFAYEDYCRSAESPETRCKYCKGRGSVCDSETLSKFHQRVMKPCPRCQGKGFKKVKGSGLFRAITAIMPGFSKASFYRYIFPVFEEMIQVCFKEESRADDALKHVTRQKD